MDIIARLTANTAPATIIGGLIILSRSSPVAVGWPGGGDPLQKTCHSDVGYIVGARTK